MAGQGRKVGGQGGGYQGYAQSKGQHHLPQAALHEQHLIVALRRVQPPLQAHMGQVQRGQGRGRADRCAQGDAPAWKGQTGKPEHRIDQARADEGQDDPPFERDGKQLAKTLLRAAGLDFSLHRGFA